MKLDITISKWQIKNKLTQIGNIIEDIQVFVDYCWRYSKYGYFHYDLSWRYINQKFHNITKQAIVGLLHISVLKID